MERVSKPHCEGPIRRGTERGLFFVAHIMSTEAMAKSERPLSILPREDTKVTRSRTIKGALLGFPK